MHSFPVVHLLIPWAVGEHIPTGQSSLLLNPNALPSSTAVPQAEITFLFREAALLPRTTGLREAVSGTATVLGEMGAGPRAGQAGTRIGQVVSSSVLCFSPQ